ncbi:MAG: response regulator transcription factor [Prevotella sp.]|nr:response regulator transcription factor [Prevotella sp.]
MEQKRILIVDDEETLCEVLKLNLQNEGYEVDIATSAEQALTYDVRSYSLILLDIMMGEISGIQMAKILKAEPATASIPIIFCTARDTEDDMIHGLDLGADDYIMKPYTIRNVIARVRSVLRRTARQQDEPEKDIRETDNVLQIDGLQLDMDLKQCFVDGKLVKLTKTEFELLAFLMAHTGKIFSRDEIVMRVWNDVIVLDRTIDVNITRLRSKIGQYGSYIITRLGFGYGFKS